ncbi:hypothetical protein [Sinomicrobium weinanense]|uniref:NigD-like protein n=1 Tax=Sinomicrobium weinanense TaxID=2842200 RepID=A0A926JVU9_9FLAO|nr:hypothetical protein [Sinomicrobium weinanense]MBC9798269.1 hypothetical protein [Sinomicrobium weinanense]MBU3125335.1 hypothetical protein [Sinomicrobium weinanense]
MKRIIFTALGLIAVSKVFTACEFNQSVHKDLKTGALSKGDGIACESITMEVNGTKDHRNTFVFGEKVNLVFNDLTGFTKIDGKTYPFLSLDIVKNEKDTVLSYANLLGDIKEGTDLSPLQLQANFTAALPHGNNEKYKLYIHIWDGKGKGNFSYELPFTIKKSELLDIERSDITYQNIYLWNESLGQPVLDKTIDFDHTLRLILEGITGLEETEGKIYPVFSIDLVDSAGNIMLSNPNVFSAYETTGINAADFKKQASAKITFQKGKVNNPCKLTATLKDRHSKKKIVVAAALEIK